MQKALQMGLRLTAMCHLQTLMQKALQMGLRLNKLLLLVKALRLNKPSLNKPRLNKPSLNALLLNKPRLNKLIIQLMTIQGSLWI